MIILVNIAQGLFVGFVSWKAWQFYKGKLKLTERQEDKRQKIVDKYGVLILLLLVLGVVSSFLLILSGVMMAI